MASDTKETENKRRWKLGRSARKRKNRESRKSTNSWQELFGPEAERKRTT